jgi:hypothetical protein
LEFSYEREEDQTSSSCVVEYAKTKSLAEYQGKGYGSISYRESTGLTYYLQNFNLFLKKNQY